MPSVAMPTIVLSRGGGGEFLPVQTDGSQRPFESPFPSTTLKQHLKSCEFLGSMVASILRIIEKLTSQTTNSTLSKHYRLPNNLLARFLGIRSNLKLTPWSKGMGRRDEIDTE